MRYLIPVDGSDASLRAAQHVASLSDPSREVVLLSVGPTLSRHVSRVTSASARELLRRDQAERRFEGPLLVLRRAGVPVRTRIARGTLGPAVAEAAWQEQATMIVLGAQRRAAWMSLLGRSPVEEVLDQAPVPVAMIADGRPSTLQRFGVPAGVGLGLTALVLSAE